MNDYIISVKSQLEEFVDTLKPIEIHLNNMRNIVLKGISLIHMQNDEKNIFIIRRYIDLIIFSDIGKIFIENQSEGYKRSIYNNIVWSLKNDVEKIANFCPEYLPELETYENYLYQKYYDIL